MKAQLGQLSGVLQFLSFETLEAMVQKMGRLNTAAVQEEFLMLTLFHNEQYNSALGELNLSAETLEQLQNPANSLMRALFEVAKFDP